MGTLKRTKKTAQGPGIGKRITDRLEELGWVRGDLLNALPDLSPQALSNLITRDSRRSEWDEAIAKALDMHVMELVYGQRPPAWDNQNVTALPIHDAPPPTIQKIIEIANSMSQQGQYVLLGRAEELVLHYPKAKANHAS
jgi:hypothetical protein